MQISTEPSTQLQSPLSATRTPELPSRETPHGFDGTRPRPTPSHRQWLADLEHDQETRDEMVAAMAGDGHAYDAEEDAMIQQRLAMLAANSAHAELSR